MNPLDREDLVRRLQRNMDPKPKTGVNGSIVIFPNTDGDWNNDADDARSTPRSKGSSRVWHDFTKEPKTEEDPDGEAFDMDEDPELMRKKEELKELREVIMRKKASLVVKKVKSFVKDTTPPGSSMPATCKGATLKDRVKAILEQRSVSSLSMVQSPVNRMNSSGPSSQDLLHEDHPLKLRVKALMGKRCRDPCVIPTNEEVPDVTPPPPRRSDASLVMEESSINLGFQRFLTVLNKGVDMEFLNRIVNDDGEDPPLGEEPLNIQPLAVENKSGLFFRSESQGSNGGDRKSNPPSQERSLNVQLPHDSQNSDRLDVRVGSCSRSKSPSPVKKTREGAEGNPKVNEQHEQLQNILKSLGLSLEEDEMTKLAKRTQERLYGKKDEDKRDDSRREQMSQQKGSHKPSFKSSSSSSGPMSRNPSPSHRRGSHSRDSRRRPTSDRSGSINRSRDGQTSQDGNQDSKKSAKHRDRDEDGNEFKEISTYQHPYPQNQSEPHPHPAEFSAFSNYTQSQSSQYYDSRCGSYSAATVSYWTFTQNGFPPPLDPSSYPYAQNSYHHFPASVVAPTTLNQFHTTLKDLNLLVNPDLSECEGQTGSVYGPRCLSVISTKQTNAQRCRTTRQEANTTGAESIRNKCNKINHCSQQRNDVVGKQKRETKKLVYPNRSLSKGQVGFIDPPRCTRVTKRRRSKRRKNGNRIKHRHCRKMDKEASTTMTRQQKASAVVKVEAPHCIELDSCAELSGDKQPQTEKQVKANIRIKLKAFNQKADQQIPTFAASQTTQDYFEYRPEESEKFYECHFDFNLL